MNYLHAYPYLCRIMSRPKPGAAYRLSGNGFVISPYYIVTTGNTDELKENSPLSPSAGLRVVMNKTEQLLEVVDYFQVKNDSAYSDLLILKLKKPLLQSPAPLVSQITSDNVRELKIPSIVYVLGYDQNGHLDVVKKQLKRFVFDDNGQLQPLQFAGNTTHLLPGAPIMANCYQANKLIKVVLGVVSHAQNHSTCDRIIDIVQHYQLPIPVGFQADNLKWPQHSSMIGFFKNIVNLVKTPQVEATKLAKVHSAGAG